MSTIRGNDNLNYLAIFEWIIVDIKLMKFLSEYYIFSIYTYVEHPYTLYTLHMILTIIHVELKY